MNGSPSSVCAPASFMRLQSKTRFSRRSPRRSAYRARRQDAFIIAVKLWPGGGTCFCVSMNTGPKAKAGFDLALTEVVGDSGHIFVVEAATDAGLTVLAEVPHRLATQEEADAAESVVTQTAASMGREMHSDDVHELLLRNLENPRWNDVAQRCLTCANCTMVCPTCFCTSVEDSSDLGARRILALSALGFVLHHGLFIHPRRQCARQLTLALSPVDDSQARHLADQFGTSGCVGCGRCITWCPVGIDITEEVRAIRDSEQH